MTDAADLQLVTSRLIPAAPQRLCGTEVTVEPVQISDERARTGHAARWAACLDRLAGYLSARPALSPH